MSEIDWSKAPEGTTHWHGGDDEFCPAFYKVVDGKATHYWTTLEPMWRKVTSFDRVIATYLMQCLPAPTPWDGTGLPPVGTVCEIHGHVHHELRKQPFEWVQCVVIAHTDFGGDPVAVAKTTDSSIGWGIGRAFRPLRTPEQIAAEEREKAVDKMVEIASNAQCFGVGRAVLGALYDAGLRFPEGDKP